MPTDLRTEDFDYPLPEELIASRPSAQRDASRMMVVDRAAGSVRCGAFTEFSEMIGDGDLAVFNDTRVVPSRFFSDDGKIEIVRLGGTEPELWRCMVRPGKKMRVGKTVTIAGVRGTVEAILERGERLLRFDTPIDIAEHGELALPHYMHRDAEQIDLERYQTVYARQPGAIAAPTAGLHFTPERVKALPHTFLTLHVGVGTFRPVRAERIADHQMHPESFEVSPETAATINDARRVIAIGTTVARVLEHLSLGGREITPGAGETDIFIYPGFEFHRTGALLTNFHLPKSTLFMLVCALAGSDLMREAYAQAVAERFRFFSYGDCMLIL